MYTQGMSTRSRLIGATAELLRERGYAGTSPAMIQRRARAGQGSMYHHFPGKAELARTAMVATAERMRAEVLAATADRDSAVERLTAFLDLERSPLLGCRLGRTVQDADVVGSETLRAPLEEFFDWLWRWTADVVADGQQRGELRDDVDPGDIAATLVATIQGGYVWHGQATAKTPSGVRSAAPRR